MILQCVFYQYVWFTHVFSVNHFMNNYMYVYCTLKDKGLVFGDAYMMTHVKITWLKQKQN